MNKENVIDINDEHQAKDNQILVEVPQKGGISISDIDDYNAMIKDLILMALPGPSKQIH